MQFGGGWLLFKIIADSLRKVSIFCKLQSFVFIPQMITIITVLFFYNSTFRSSQTQKEEKSAEIETGVIFSLTHFTFFLVLY
jgi:hypothetical protein